MPHSFGTISRLALQSLYPEGVDLFRDTEGEWEKTPCGPGQAQGLLCHCQPVGSAGVKAKLGRHSRFLGDSTR